MHCEVTGGAARTSGRRVSGGWRRGAACYRHLRLAAAIFDLGLDCTLYLIHAHVDAFDEPQLSSAEMTLSLALESHARAVRMSFLRRRHRRAEMMVRKGGVPAFSKLCRNVRHSDRKVVSPIEPHSDRTTSSITSACSRCHTASSPSCSCVMYQIVWFHIFPAGSPSSSQTWASPTRLGWARCTPPA